VRKIAYVIAFGLIAYPTVALSCLGILLATLGTVMRLARNAALIYLGKISYGLYVYHLFGLWLAKRLFSGLHGFSYFTICICAALVITFSCASLSYHFLELPFLRLKRRFTCIPSRPV
jgi:peptidoglycan/LPS O-acetylase OafA/YrhL